MRRADSAPARWPAERGSPRAVAQRPLPSEMMATCRPGASANGVFVVMMCCVVRGSMFFTSFSAAGKSIINYSATQSRCAKKYAFLALARCANQGFHVVQVTLQRATARRRQTVFCLGQPSIKRFRANDIVRFLELARVHAQIAIRGLQQGLQLIES